MNMIGQGCAGLYYDKSRLLLLDMEQAAAEE